MGRMARRFLLMSAFSVLFCRPGDLRAAAAAPEAFQPAGRSTLFNEHWKFVNADPGGAEQLAHDDAEWRDLTLPHDWSAEGPMDPKWASGTGFLPGGVGWYRKSFTLPPALTGRRISIRFDGVYKNSQVWCNGQLLGTRPNGYLDFQYDLTPHLLAGDATNVIAVRVDHSDFADSRWYPGSGINRNVWLIATSDVHVAPHGTYVTTPKVNPANATVEITTTVRSEKSAADVTVNSILLDAGGAEVARASSAGTVAMAANWESRQSLSVVNPRLWSTEHPSLYKLRTQVLRDGKTVDEYDTPIGIRTFAFDPQKGFSLNGASMKLKGVCLHDDAGALGAVVPAAVWEYRLRKLRDAGCNAIRTSHNPPPPDLLDLCDRMGFLVMDEAFDEWTGPKKKWVNGVNRGAPSLNGYHKDFEQWAETDLRDMLLRDRNHPSIILWSIGNEIDYKNDPFPPNAPELAKVAERLVRVVKQLDTTRPVTAACASVPTNLFCDQLDVVGYNYQEKLYTDDHAQHPNRIIYGSENSHRVADWRAVTGNEFIAGQFLWTGADYLGESGGWPSRGSAAGLLDLAGFEKPMYYFRKSLWTDAPMVHLSSESPRGLRCYTNCERVELFKNGTSIGERALSPEQQINLSDLQFDSDLKAVGKKDGVAVCEFELKKPGTAAKLALKPMTATLTASAQDVAVIEVRVTDAEGHRVMNAAPLVACTIEGPGRLLAMENGDLTNHENGLAGSLKAFRGRLILYVQARSTTGQINVQVSADGLTAASTQLAVQ